MDNILCDNVCRSCFCTEDKGYRTLRLLACLDLQVTVDDIKCVQLLTFVLMKTFDLDIINTVCVDLLTCIGFDKLRTSLLCILLDLKDIGKNVLISLKSKHLVKLKGILAEAVTDHGCDVLSQRMVAVKEPSAEGNPICLVIEFLRIDLIELMKLCLLQDIGMKGCNTVDGKSVVDVHMCHMDQVVLVDDGKIFLRIFCFDTLVQLADDRHQVRNNLLKIRDRPFLKCLCKNGMVGISAYMRYDLACLLKLDPTLCEKTDKFRNYHTRMCIVDLDHCIIGKVMKIAAFCCCLIQNQLCRIAYHEVLLIDTKLSSCVIAVIRIQEQCQVVEQILLIKGDSLAYNALICNINIKKAKLDRFVLIACHVNIIQCGFQHKALKRHVIGNACICKPALRLDPRIRCLKLKMILKLLFEKSEVIIKSDSFSRKSQSCDGIQEASCQTAKSAISERWLRLDLLDHGKLFSVFFKIFRNFIVNAQIDQVVGKKLTDKELCGNIINFLFSFLVAAALQLLLCPGEKSVIDFLVCTIFYIFVIFVFKYFA